MKEKSLLFENSVVKVPEDAVNVVREYYSYSYGEELPDREVSVGLWLNTKNKFTGIETLSMGTLNAALMHPREIF